MIKEMLMKARQKSNLSREKNAVHRERKKEKEIDYIIQRATKAKVGEMFGGLCMCGGERAQKAGKESLVCNGGNQRKR